MQNKCARRSDKQACCPIRLAGRFYVSITRSTAWGITNLLRSVTKKSSPVLPISRKIQRTERCGRCFIVLLCPSIQHYENTVACSSNAIVHRESAPKTVPKVRHSCFSVFCGSTGKVSPRWSERYTTPNSTVSVAPRFGIRRRGNQAPGTCPSGGRARCGVERRRWRGGGGRYWSASRPWRDDLGSWRRGNGIRSSGRPR